MKIDIKPLSVNQAWKGRRFKTDKYKKYEIELMLLLKKIDIPDGNLSLYIDVGFSSNGSDIDNIAKPFIDILQKKYGFNDSRIYQLTIVKSIVKKGDEYIEFYITKFNLRE